MYFKTTCIIFHISDR